MGGLKKYDTGLANDEFPTRISRLFAHDRVNTPFRDNVMGNKYIGCQRDIMFMYVDPMCDIFIYIYPFIVCMHTFINIYIINSQRKKSFAEASERSVTIWIHVKASKILKYN